METQDFQKTNLDSDKFSTDKYLAQLLKTNGIKDLYQKNYELQKNIKSYDQDIQQIVFENYNKFISSIDTVKKMKEGIEKVEGKLKNLENQMSKINSLSTQVTSALSVKHQEIQKLDTVNKDLMKLNNICQFPTILKSDLKTYHSSSNKYLSTHFEQSLEIFKKCFDVLNNLQNEPFIKPIFQDCQQSLDQIRAIYWSLLNNKDLELSDHRIIVQKLVIVIEDQSFVIKNYYKNIKDKIQAKIIYLFEQKKTILSNKQQFEEELKEISYQITIEQIEEKISQQNIQSELAEQLQTDVFNIVFDEISYFFQNLIVLVQGYQIQFQIQRKNKFVKLLKTLLKKLFCLLISNLIQKFKKVNCKKLKFFKYTKKYKHFFQK